jgi:hypothetical protein
MIIKTARLLVLVGALVLSIFGLPSQAQAGGCIFCDSFRYPDLDTCDAECYNACLTQTGVPACVDCTECVQGAQAAICKCYTSFP